VASESTRWRCLRLGIRRKHSRPFALRKQAEDFPSVSVGSAMMHVPMSRRVHLAAARPAPGSPGASCYHFPIGCPASIIRLTWRSPSVGWCWEDWVRSTFGVRDSTFCQDPPLRRAQYATKRGAVRYGDNAWLHTLRVSSPPRQVSTARTSTCRISFFCRTGTQLRNSGSWNTRAEC